MSIGRVVGLFTGIGLCLLADFSQETHAMPTPKGVMTELPSSVLYSPGSAQIRQEVKSTLDFIGTLFVGIGRLPFHREVEGHADSDPGSGGSRYEDTRPKMNQAENPALGIDEIKRQNRRVVILIERVF